MNVVMYIVSGEHLSERLLKLLSTVSNLLTDGFEAQANEVVVEAAVGLATKSVRANLTQKISNESMGMRSLAIQVTTIRYIY